ncbi:MAG: DUF1189 family protein, partial [Legionellales bacterium]
DVGKRWTGVAFLYLLLVIILFSIPLGARVCLQFNTMFEESIIGPLAKLPTLYIQNGSISFEKPMPYFIKDPKGEVVLIVDTTGVINSFPNEYPKLTTLINKNVIFFKLPSPNILNSPNPPVNNAAPIAQYLDPNVNSVFEGSQFVSNSSILKLKIISLVLIYPIIVSAICSFFMIMFPVVALLGQVFSNIFFAFQIRYTQALRLLIVSSTPMLLVLFVHITLNNPFKWMGFILIPILIAYFTFALRALKSESMQVVSQ